MAKKEKHDLHNVSDRKLNFWSYMADLCNKRTRFLTQDIPIDIGNILFHRFRLHFGALIWLRVKAMSEDPDCPELKNEELSDLFNRVTAKELISFGRDCERYQERHNETVDETVKKARESHKQSIYRLVKRDKHFLAEDYIPWQISRNQLYNDNTFFISQ